MITQYTTTRLSRYLHSGTMIVGTAAGRRGFNSSFSMGSLDPVPEIYCSTCFTNGSTFAADFVGVASDISRYEFNGKIFSSGDNLNTFFGDVIGQTISFRVLR